MPHRCRLLRDDSVGDVSNSHLSPEDIFHETGPVVGTLFSNRPQQ